MASPFISVSASELDPAKLKRVLADYVEVERARIFRQLLLKRLALIAITVGIVTQWLHVLTRAQLGIIFLIFSAPGLLALVMELKARSRLTRELSAIDATATHGALPPSMSKPEQNPCDH